MKAATIIEIAERAGVSMKTVSRVLNGEPNVRPSTQEKVRKAAKELNYTPNISARSLASKKSFIIVHLHDNPNPDYLDKVYQGVHKTCREAGYFAVMEPLAQPYANNARDYLDQFKIDGLILSPPICDDAAVLDLLIDRAIPFVRISPTTNPDISSSTYMNEAEAVERMTSLLIDLGHKNIAFISGPDKHGSSHVRATGFKNALRKAGISAELCPVIQGDFSVKSGFSAGQDILDRYNAVTAVFAANDDMATGVVMAALKSGRDIPKEFSVAGFDGSRLGDIICPTLTTLRQPVRDLAAKATELLLLEIFNPDQDKQHIEFDVDLLVRGTTSSRGVLT